jgi:hypothetical protein
VKSEDVDTEMCMYWHGEGAMHVVLQRARLVKGGLCLACVCAWVWLWGYVCWRQDTAANEEGTNVKGAPRDAKGSG